MAEYINPRAQACQNCVKAKAKCYGHKDGQCERCSRLGRECAMQPSIVRKRKSKKAIVHTQRIAELEEKVESLVSILGTRPLLSTSGNILSPIVTDKTITTPSTSFDLSDPALSLQGHSTSTNLTSAQIDSSNTGSHFYTQPLSEGNLRNPSPLTEVVYRTLTDPDELLAVFRQDLARLTPFIFIGLDENAQRLSLERPFLYRAIITVSSYHNSVNQIKLGESLLRDITEYLVLKGQKSLDCLQGLMLFISWYNGLFFGKAQLNTLLGLAFSLVVDLHLYLPIARFQNHEKFLVEMKSIVASNDLHTTWIRRAEPTKDELRTILGCFCLFSSVSTNFCQINPLKWTPYIQHCYDEILKAPDNSNDEYLAHLSELQRISEEIRQGGFRSFPSQRRTWNSATQVHFRLLISELERFKALLPECLKKDPLILLHYYAVEMHLTEVCFSMPPTTLSQVPHLSRADVLLRCMTATQAYLDVHSFINSKPYLAFFTVFITQVYFAMMTISKLMLFTGEDWDVSQVPRSMNLFAVVDRLATIMENGSAHYDHGHESKPWLTMSRKIQQIRVRFERLLASENSSRNPMPQEGVFDLLDETFWQSLADDGSYFQ